MDCSSVKPLAVATCGLWVSIVHFCVKSCCDNPVFELDEDEHDLFRSWSWRAAVILAWTMRWRCHVTLLAWLLQVTQRVACLGSPCQLIRQALSLRSTVTPANWVHRRRWVSVECHASTVLHCLASMLTGHRCTRHLLTSVVEFHAKSLWRFCFYSAQCDIHQSELHSKNDFSSMS